MSTLTATRPDRDTAPVARPGRARRRVVELEGGRPYDLGCGVAVATGGLEAYQPYPRAWMTISGTGAADESRWVDVGETVELPFGRIELLKVWQVPASDGFNQDGDRASVAVHVDGEAAGR